MYVIVVQSIEGALTDTWNTGATTDQFNHIDLVKSKPRVGQGTMKWPWDTIDDMSDQTFHLHTSEFGRGVNVVHDGFNIKRDLGVGRKDLLKLLASSTQPEKSFRVRHDDINIVLCLELFREMFEEGVINVLSTKVVIVRCAFNGQLAL